MFSVIDTASNTVTATIPVGTGASGVVFSPDGTHAYVTNFSDGTISVIDTATNAVTTTITVGGGRCSAAITPDGKNLYVPDFSGNVRVVSTVTQQPDSYDSRGVRSQRCGHHAERNTRLCFEVWASSRH